MVKVLRYSFSYPMYKLKKINSKTQLVYWNGYITQHWEKSKLCNCLNLWENIGSGFEDKPLVSIAWEKFKIETLSNPIISKPLKELVTNKQFYG